MDAGRFKKITEILKSTLDEYRYIHTLGVAGTSAALAMRYEYDVDKAEIAGLLHDCAKSIPTKEKYRICSEAGIKLTKFELENQSLVHAKLGANIAQQRYGEEDEELLDAIRTHTTGKADMTLLQKIVYTADLIEPHRDDFITDISSIRRVAFTDIDEAVYIIADRSLRHLEKSGKPVDTAPRDTFEFYKKIHDSKA